ncbi:MAG TPA: hypothetical protein P5244_10775 [Syntrophales bacterium]|nr:hypothetical protein [Syntrophobacterales bacterium]HRR41703.1 hypothetical protein [Syntrophales bacterium]HRT27716.1 hypothetical protein [Syntrophales bacterium]HRT70861.1 hypothetical protein [Syntrophales bacterium]
MTGPLDIKQVLLQINSVERVQQVQQQHPEMQQRYLDIQLGEEKKLLKENVSHADNTNKTEEKRIREREKLGRKSGDRREGRKGRPDEGEGEDGAPGGHVDVRV